MKFSIVILAVCLTTIQAAVAPPYVEYETQVKDIVHEIEKIAIETAQELEQRLEEIIIEPLNQVEDAVLAIEKRKEENEKCVAEQEEIVALTVDAVHDEMNVCGSIAAKTSAEIMVDVNKATQQLVYGGVNIVATYRKCKSYKYSAMRKSCYLRLSVTATIYLKNSRKSIRTINESTKVRIPAVFVDANACTHTAAEKAIQELENVNTQIDVCIANA